MQSSYDFFSPERKGLCPTHSVDHIITCELLSTDSSSSLMGRRERKKNPVDDVGYSPPRSQLTWRRQALIDRALDCMFHLLPFPRPCLFLIFFSYLLPPIFFYYARAFDWDEESIDPDGLDLMMFTDWFQFWLDTFCYIFLECYNKKLQSDSEASSWMDCPVIGPIIGKNKVWKKIKKKETRQVEEENHSTHAWENSERIRRRRQHNWGDVSDACEIDNAQCSPLVRLSRLFPPES